MYKFQIGDPVVYVRLPNSFYDNGRCGCGYIYHIEPYDMVNSVQEISVIVHNESPQIIPVGKNKSLVLSADLSPDANKRDLISFVNQVIDNEKKNLRELTSEEKDQLRIDEFHRIKDKINATAKHMIESEYDADFVNKLKEINRLHKMLFSIKVSDLDNVHKHNGAVKSKIRKLEQLRDSVERYDFNIYKR